MDYTENFAPVVNDVTFRLALVIGLIKKWKMKNLDVETAFLEGKLENDIYMKMPPGYETILESLKDDPSFAKILANWDKNTVGELGRCIYGLVQASRQWYKTMAEVLTKKLGFSRSMKDPCLFYRKNEKGEIIICLYVDDTAMIGDPEALEDTEAKLKKFFTVKVTELNEYVGCTFIRTKKGFLLHQLHLLKRLEETFGEKINHLPVYDIPLPAGYSTAKPSTEESVLKDSEQTEYQSGVGMSLYLVKLSRPEIANPTRELSKQMQKANYGHEKNMLCLLKFILNT